MSGTETFLTVAIIVLIVVVAFVAYVADSNVKWAKSLNEKLIHTEAMMSVRDRALAQTQSDVRYFQSLSNGHWADNVQLRTALAVAETTPPKSTPQAALIDQVIEKEQTELEHAKAAYYRITHTLANDLSAEASGAGPLFSSSKFKVAERSVEALFNIPPGDADWQIVDGWIANHPDQWEKLR